MIILPSVASLKEFRKSLHGKKIGFVPTMGALHAGHAELLKKARSENEIVILSIFVNPTQFNDPKDLEKYPRNLEADQELAKQNGVDALFCPEFSEMYPDKFRYQISEKEFSTELCGKDRPGHFDGVLTVVMKLFNLVAPTKVYFGEKDFQQLSLIRGMIEAFFMDIELVPVPTVRETTGLALSSRNVRLNQDEFIKAPMIYETITSAGTADEAKRKLSEYGFHVDYVVDKGDRRYVAAKLGSVRLIDNVSI